MEALHFRSAIDGKVEKTLHFPLCPMFFKNVTTNGAEIFVALLGPVIAVYLAKA